MSKPDQKQIAKALLREYGHTFSEELRLGAERNTPSGLFQLLCFALLSSTRISHSLAARAMTALRENGWRTPSRMAEATWRRRTDVLNRAGYARYDESTSRYLEDTSRHLLENYNGDLRKLREAAGEDPEEERRRLQEFKGIGRVGAGIFQREVQAIWPEIFPFADKKALDSAARLKLSRDPRKLAKLVPRPQEFSRLVAALIRCGMDKGYDRVLATADQ